MSAPRRPRRSRPQYRSFEIGPGLQVDPLRPAGYHVDMSVKAPTADWPPLWVHEDPTLTSWVALAQFGLGAFERFIRGEGDAWLALARRTGDHFLEHQEQGGPLDGAWRFPEPIVHTYAVRPGWVSAMAQGEAASLLARLALVCGDDRYRDGAVRALGPYGVPVSQGGVRAELGGGPWFEEYPTSPSSYVLNGGIFALWGLYDVATAFGDAAARAAWDEGVETLAAHIGRWDLGYWSRYDLFPHPLSHAASEAYHTLHTLQVEATVRLHPDPRLRATHERFVAYGRSPVCRARGVAAKVVFRLTVPRNRWVAKRLPWKAVDLPEIDV